MGFIRLEELVEGMVLADDVLDRSGRVLLGRGMVLNSRHIRMFMTWGVRQADIQGEESLTGQERAPEMRDMSLVQAAEDELKPLFRNVDMENPAIAELFRLCVDRKVCNAAR